ncbi:ComEC/Rec2 family competence protein [Blautia intestinalis]|uniref:ComEC/Rec2 family competence protein n=1 Tax=Blautia intestinalis TaxID=2763028 RepID=UPI0022E8A8C0|nr:ComEC/Rec2 family competence protein [Blautia intestinalis]
MKKQNRFVTFILSVLLALTLVLPGSAVTAKADGQGNMAVHFIDVGQGLAILVQSGGENLLYDGGNRSHADEVVQYLKNQQVETINYMISSHYDEDHLGGLVKCLDNFEVGHVLGSDYVHTSDLFNTFMNTATAHAIIVEYPSVGDTYEFGTGSFTVMAPDGISQNSNDNSVVIRLVNGNNSFMFMGDAEETSEQDMISTGMNLDCDVLSLGHHGSASSTSWDLLEAASPSWAVISCGLNNSYGHPAAETMGKLSDMDIPVFRTDDQGTVIALSDGNTISWNQEPCNDYTSGSEKQSTDSSADQSEQDTNDAAATESYAAETDTSDTQGRMVWISATGSKYHSIPDCGNMNPDKATQETESQALSQGYEACKKCW